MEALISEAGSQSQRHGNHTDFGRESGRRQRRAKGKQKLWLNREISGRFYQEEYWGQALRVFVMETISVGIQEAGNLSLERAQDFL